MDAARAVMARLRLVLGSGIEHLDDMREPALRWLARGAAVAAAASVVMLIGVNRGLLFSRWNHVAAIVTEAANRPPVQLPRPAPIPAGVGRLNVESSVEDAVVLVDGKPRGTAPVSVDLPPGPHRILLRSSKGSVERSVKIQAGETSEMSEPIFPGWIALTAPIELSLSEDGQPLKRDDRGWAILQPGPHEIHLDNRALGIHEVRHVVVMPGDTTRLSFAPHTSTLSLTTNEPAEVWVDGNSVGQAPLVEQTISIGLHDVRVRSAQHERWLRLRVTTQPVQVNVDLTAAR